MSNKIQETMERGVEEFNEKYCTPPKEASFITTDMFKNNKDILLPWLKAHQTALLEAVLEEVENEAHKKGHASYSMQNANHEYVTISIDELRTILKTIINKAIGV